MKFLNIFLFILYLFIFSVSYSQQEKIILVTDEAISRYVIPKIKSILSAKGYRFLKTRTTDVTRTLTEIFYRPGFHEKAVEISHYISGPTKVLPLTWKESDDIIIALGSSLLYEDVGKKSFSFNQEIKDNQYTLYITMGNIEIKGWNEKGDIFVHEEIGHGCCGDATTFHTVTLFQTTTGKFARFLLSLNPGNTKESGIDVSYSYKVAHCENCYHRAYYEDWLKNNKLINYSNFKSKDKNYQIQVFHGDNDISPKETYFQWETETFDFSKKTLLSFVLINVKKEIIYKRSVALDITAGGFPSGHITASWSPDKKRMVILNKPSDFSAMMPWPCTFLLFPATSPIISIVYNHNTDSNKITFLKGKLSNQGYFIADIHLAAKERKQSVIYYHEDYKETARFIALNFLRNARIEPISWKSYSHVVIALGE